jgi:hypothetical protein
MSEGAMSEIPREYVYTMPFAGMKQIVRRSLTMLTKETFLYIEIRPQTTNDPDYVLFEIWNKKKDFRLGDVDVAKFSEQQTGVAFQVEHSIEGGERDFLNLFIELFFDKVSELHRAIELLQKAQNTSALVEANTSETRKINETTSMQLAAPLHPIDLGLDWYAQEKAAGRKATLPQVADRSGYSLSAVNARRKERKEQAKKVQ